MQRRHLAPLLVTAAAAATLTIGAPVAGASQPAAVVGAPACTPVATPTPDVHATTAAAGAASRTSTTTVGLPGFESSTGKLLGATISLVVTTDRSLTVHAHRGSWWAAGSTAASTTAAAPGASPLEVDSHQQLGVGTSVPPVALRSNFNLLGTPNPHFGPALHAMTSTTAAVVATGALEQYLASSVPATVTLHGDVQLIAAHAEATSTLDTAASLCVAYRYLPILSVTAGMPTGAVLVTGISTVGFSGWLLRSRRRDRPSS